MGNLTVIGKPLKSIGEIWFPGLVGPNKNSPPTDPSPGKERFQNRAYENDRKPLETKSGPYHFRSIKGLSELYLHKVILA